MIDSMNKIQIYAEDNKEWRDEWIMNEWISNGKRRWAELQFTKEVMMTIYLQQKCSSLCIIIDQHIICGLKKGRLKVTSYWQVTDKCQYSLNSMIE